MSKRADKLFEDAQALPDEERAILALQLLDSVGEPESEVERACRTRCGAVSRTDHLWPDEDDEGG